jgi:hypothetical protein
MTPPAVQMNAFTPATASKSLTSPTKALAFACVSAKSSVWKERAAGIHRSHPRPVPATAVAVRERNAAHWAVSAGNRFREVAKTTENPTTKRWPKD